MGVSSFGDHFNGTVPSRKIQEVNVKKDVEVADKKEEDYDEIEQNLELLSLKV